MSESGHSRQRRTEPIVDPCPATPKSGRKFTGVGAAPGLRPRRDERLPSKGDVRSRADDGAPVAGKLAMETSVKQCAALAVGARIATLRFGRR
jgi:hypothetical protein